MSEVADEIEGFLRAALGVTPDDPGYTRDADLFDGGFVDSVGFAELLAFLAERFGVEVPEEELLSDAFSSVAGIATVVERLRGGAAA